MTTNTTCNTTCPRRCESGNGFFIVLVIFILLAIILSSCFIF